MMKFEIYSHAQSFKSYTDAEVEEEMLIAVADEKKSQTRVLHVLAEVERRRIYSKNYPSLFEYCTRRLKYSNGAAQRRIDTMRAMKVMPEIESKIISGDLNLTSVSQAQTFFRHEAKKDKSYSVVEKRDLLRQLENKSTRQCTETLVAISPQSVSADKRRPLTLEKTEMKVTLDKDLIEKLDRIKALMSHKKPQMTDAELLNAMADICLAKLDPVLKRTKSMSTGDVGKLIAVALEEKSLPAPEVSARRSVLRRGSQEGSPKAKSRYIPSELKKAVWTRDKGKCTHPNCNSRHFLEIDHIEPVAFGGKTDLSNLRLLCRAHNQRAAIEALGSDHMGEFLDQP